MHLSDFQALNLFIKLAETAGFITKESSLKSQRQVRYTQTTVTMIQELVKSYGMKKEVAQSLWHIVKMAPSPKEDLNNLGSVSQVSKSQISLQEIPKELRNQVCFAEELIRRKLVPLEEINKILEQIQKDKKNLSMGQLLLRKHLISPDQFIQINQQSIGNSNKKELQVKIMLNGRKNIYYIGSAETPSIMGRYEIIREIARGGMGVVYEARDIELDRIVALKTMIAGDMADKTDLERFQRESKLTASFNHPNIVKIYEVGIFENTPYFTMDYIEGLPLSEYIRKTKLSLKKLVSMMLEIADALSYAHSMGVIHRDIKPGNILVDTTGRPLVTDFGLARQQDSNEGLTMSGVALGTPSYMPPEQAEGRIREIDARSDIYSYGAVLYEVLAGRPPFSGASLAETLHAVIHEEPIPIRQLVQGLPMDIETICMKCLEKNRKKRYPNAKALIKDMERFLKGDSIRARRVSPIERFQKWTSKNKITVIAMSLMILLFFLMIFSKISDVNEIENIKKQAEEKISQIEKDSKEKYKKREKLYYEQMIANVKEEREKAEKLEEENSKLKKELKNKIKLVKKNNEVHNDVQWRKLGVSYFNRGLYSKSVDAFTKAIKVKPYDERAYSLRAVVFMKIGRHYEAIQDMNKSISIKPTVDAYNNRGIVYLKMGNLTKALKDFNMVIKFNPVNYGGYSNRAVVLEKLGKYKEALKDIEKSMSLNPQGMDMYIARANIYVKMNLYRRALADLKKCLDYPYMEKYGISKDKIKMKMLDIQRILNKN